MAGSGSRETASSNTHRKQRTHWKQGEALNSYSLPLLMYCLEPFHNLSDWGQSVRMPKPRGAFLIQGPQCFSNSHMVNGLLNVCVCVYRAVLLSTLLRGALCCGERQPAETPIQRAEVKRLSECPAKDGASISSLSTKAQGPSQERERKGLKSSKNGKKC